MAIATSPDPPLLCLAQVAMAAEVLSQSEVRVCLFLLALLCIEQPSFGPCGLLMAYAVCFNVAI